MATFQQHVNVAVVATGVMIVPFNSAGVINTSESLVLLGLGLIGGVLPDLDSDNSKPVQITFKMISIFFPLLFVLAIGKDMAIFKILILWLASTILLHQSLFKLFLSLTTHRGIFHTIPMGFIFAQLCVIFFLYVLDSSPLVSVLSGAFLFFGFIIHLLLDELISLNALGSHIKKSFGSAFKFYSKYNPIGSIILYFIIAILFYYIDLDLQIYIDLIEPLKNIKLF